MEIIGFLHFVSPETEFSASFKKRDFVLKIEDNPQYPQYVSFQLTQEKCGLITAFTLGAGIKVQFNLRGFAWVSPTNETKYFNTLEAWRLESAVIQQHQSLPPIGANPEVEAAMLINAPLVTQIEELKDDDLPF
jgi:hypothetical protein